MIIIKITSEVRTRDVNGKRGDFTVRFQEGDLLTPDKRPRYVEVTPPKDSSYETDTLYTVAPHCIRTNNYDRLELSKYIDLIPLGDGLEFLKCLQDTSSQ